MVSSNSPFAIGKFYHKSPHSCLPSDFLLFYLKHFITGMDYIVNLTNPLSRIFTVSFLPLQANSTENTIQLFDDGILEGTESFGLRIAQARFSGQAADIFRADDTLNNAFAQVNIADDDCECRKSCRLHHFVYNSICIRWTVLTGMPCTVSSHSCRGQLYHLTTSGGD